MAYKLSRSPLGLLGLLELKTQGLNPQQFGDLVTPTFDVTKFYAGAPEVVSVQFMGAIAAGDTLPFAVPRSEIWWVRQTGQRLIVAAAETFTNQLSWAVLYENQPGAPVGVLASSLLNPTTPVGGVFAVFYQSQAQDIFIGPGSNVFAQIGSAVSAADWNFSLSIVRIPI